MNNKEYTQIGTVSLFILLPFLLFLTYKMGKPEVMTGKELMIWLPGLIALIFCLLLLYKLTITVNERQVSFKMGIGIISKKYNVEDIKSCRPVMNTFSLGFGIRLIRNGWLYNVSGLKAIELQFKNKSSVVQIGTDRPQEICEVIQGLIGRNSQIEPAVIVPKRKLNWQILILAAVIIFVFYIIIAGSREQRITFSKDQLKISGLYGITIPLNEITGVDTIATLPGISLRTNGYALGGTLKGNFRLKNNSKAKLFINAGHKPYIHIRAKNRPDIYINFKDKEKTVELFNKLNGMN